MATVITCDLCDHKQHDGTTQVRRSRLDVTSWAASQSTARGSIDRNSNDPKTVAVAEPELCSQCHAAFVEWLRRSVNDYLNTRAAKSRT